MWDNICKLLNTTFSNNENGVSKKKYVENEVFCNEKSVTSDEFYKSSQEGNEVKVVLEVNLIDYNNEQYVIYQGIKYKIKRTYKINRDTIELHLILKEGLNYEE